MSRNILLLLVVTLLFSLGSLTAPVSQTQAAPLEPVTVPILLYHHIGNPKGSDRYYVAEGKFQKQMKLLHELGYRTITVKRLTNILSQGGYLPQRPIIISFDDGNLSVYEKAYPVMEKFGFTGTVYIVSNRLKSKDFMHKRDLSELADSGWEIGSHSMTHTDLVQNHQLVRQEILQSRLDLEKALDIKVNSFAYPFGLADAYVMKKVYDYGYKAGVGLGTSVNHTQGTMYYLSRREVYGDYSMKEFSNLLPWTTPLPPILYRHYKTD
jgi:peptidoglycan/xylan/chitin deacetylase (PgdA/CDA1 family)